MTSIAEPLGRLLSEAAGYGYAAPLMGMLLFTSAIYGLFFIGMGWFFCGSGMGGVGLREPEVVTSSHEKQNVSELPPYVQKAFVRKVYAILSIQIFTTVVI